MKDLFQEEEKVLSRYLKKIEDKDVYIEDAETFANYYKDLIDQSKVITRISDRLQKKLDMANQKIKAQNQTISEKNTQLEHTLFELKNAKMGKKASRILLLIAIGLFVSEEYILEPIIDSFVNIPYLGLISKAAIAFSLKFIEGGLESYYMNKEKEEILKNKGKSADRKISFSQR